MIKQPNTFTRIFSQGSAKVTVGDKTWITTGPDVVHIPGDVPHGLEGLSDVFTFLYTFPYEGPFESVIYTFDQTEEKKSEDKEPEKVDTTTDVNNNSTELNHKVAQSVAACS